jgi:hypothetical protein
MIQCQNPVEWVVDWPLAWLLTYQGSNCELWRIVLEKCMESELCRRVIEMLPAIGYSLAEHRCYDSLDAEIFEADHNNQSKPS